MEKLEVVPQEEVHTTVVKKEELYILICSLLLGLLFDILFYRKPLGISYPLFVIAFYMVFLGNLRHRIAFEFSFGWLLSVPIIALSSTYFLFSNQIFATFNFLIIPFLIVAQTILLTEDNNYQWFDTRFIKDIVNGIFRRALGNTLKPLVVGLSSLRIRENAEKHMVIRKVLIGLTICIPLLMIIISLLTSADRVFKHFIDELLSSFIRIDLSDFPLQGLLVLCISVIVFSYTWSFLKPKDMPNQMQRGGTESIKSNWDSIISITILSVINCVYLVFLTIQFAYMFGALHNALPPDFTYADYARRGFFELLMVTLINFSLLMSSIRFTRKDGKLLARTVQILHSLLVLCTMVILVSAYSRMSLYEAAYGYTYLRVLTHSFMMFLCVLFIIAFYKIWNERISLLKPYIVVTLISYMLLNFVNVDVLIVKNNVARYVETGKLDTHYLKNLSYDSIPVLVKLLNKEDTPPDLKQYLGEQQKILSKKQAWQAYNLSRQKAKQVLSQ